MSSRINQVVKPVTQIAQRSFAHRYAPSEPLPAGELPIGDSAFTQSSLYGSYPEMTYGGALSFLRRKYSKNVFGHGEKVISRVLIVLYAHTP